MQVNPWENIKISGSNKQDAAEDNVKIIYFMTFETRVKNKVHLQRTFSVGYNRSATNTTMHQITIAVFIKLCDIPPWGSAAVPSSLPRPQ
jgi:hypothetical protein